MRKETLTLKLSIHNTPAALRFGSDGYFVTFAGTEEDSQEAMLLNLMKRKQLKLTIEIDE